MSNIIIVGYVVEGTTDDRFLGSIIRKTFHAIALECQSLISIHSVENIPGNNSEGFVNMVRSAAKDSKDRGVMVLCVHTDADGNDHNNAHEFKITPAFEQVSESEDNICKILVPIVPVTMVESWMLADIPLLIEEIGTNKTANDLGLTREPEEIADPKAYISEAIRIALEDNTRRRRRDISISELYLPIGQKMTITALETLASYRRFKDAVRDAYRKLNYLH